MFYKGHKVCESEYFGSKMRKRQFKKNFKKFERSLIEISEVAHECAYVMGRGCVKYQATLEKVMEINKIKQREKGNGQNNS